MTMRKSFSKETWVFILIAVFFMLLADHFIFGGKRTYIETLKTETLPTPEPEHAEKAAESVSPAPILIRPEEGEEYLEEIIPSVEMPPPPEAEPEPEPETVTGKAPPPPLEGKARIAVIIDDIGMDIKRSRAALSLPAAVTLALLPYAESAPKLARQAQEKGHELMIHVPMEPMNRKLSLGGMGLRGDMDEAAFQARFDEILSSFKGYSGINNHMGSRLTQDQEMMARVMARLKKEGLFFVDSRTIATSVAGEMAARAGLPHAARDVFLDHEDTPDFVAKSLEKLEALAHKNGHAIAIGHPKDVTLAALEAWVQTLGPKGIELVPVSALLTNPSGLSARAPDPQPVPPPE
ncbi:MAG: divergent polysaccharide deacetylase family protein [Rhodospirillales bacterium]|nr:divergent polysaccharide deacetylase family protein [Alphaproteobacteria bacterium]USO03316.1 MAG: divergent polysaccharide deacetylase family protein [Rhodospirillales bacterium]